MMIAGSPRTSASLVPSPMSDHDLAIIPGSVVRKVLEGQEDLVLAAVREAYLAHGAGLTRTPETKPLYTGGGRFFAMPASLEDARPVVGVKWVASFVANVSSGGERASAMLMVNDAVTGRPVAIVDGTLISARRTAAGAALALRCVTNGAPPRSIALVGCGPINYEVLRFIAHLFPIDHVQLVDLQEARTEAFAERVRSDFPAITAATARLTDALQTAEVMSFATNATVPYVEELPKRPLTILHLSLRDLAPRIIADAYNIVDDVEHVCSARTSVHLAAEETGRRDFIRATIPELLSESMRYEPPVAAATIISPFGMAILDLAVLREVLVRAANDPEVVRVPSFHGTVW
jgi:2,3-diaminopropionate biosynthesis protein SbnB